MNDRRNRFIAIVAKASAPLLVAALVGACASRTETALSASGSPAKGWSTYYNSLIADYVATVPELLAVPPDRMRALCPRWGGLDGTARQRFWGDLFHAMAIRESTLNRFLMTLQKSGAPDRVTGRQLTNEGLLQLSYQDEVGYRCILNWAADAPKFEQDWKLQDQRRIAEDKSMKWFMAQSTERAMHEPETQFACAVTIASFEVWRGLPQGKSLEQALGTYWAVLQPSTLHRTVDSLRGLAPYCF